MLPFQTVKDTNSFQSFPRRVISRLVCLIVLGFCPQTLPAKTPAGESAAHLNIVIIMAVDMGYSDLPKFGKSEIPTPNIDRLANEGTLFTDAYVTAPICVASRMGLLSGQYQQRFGKR